MSLVSIRISEFLVNAVTIGKSEWVAKNGASSVMVYMIFDLRLMLYDFFGKKLSINTGCKYKKYARSI